MYQFGHYGAALLVYAPLGVVVALAGFETVAILGGLACIALSTLPDCDHRLPFVEHRGPTHSVLFAVLVGGALAAATAALLEAASPMVELGLVAFAFVVGSTAIFSHLLTDAITPMGIRPFWPVSTRRYTADLTPAKSPVANYLLFGAGIVVSVGAIMLVTTVG